MSRNIIFFCIFCWQVWRLRVATLFDMTKSWQLSLSLNTQRFVSNDFPRDHRPTTGKADFFPSLVLNEALFQLKLIDLPPIPYFPADTDAEWRDFRFFGLRSASAYLLVYDASAPYTFQHVKALREQMFECRDMTNVPVIVAANKADKAVASASANITHHHHHHKGARTYPFGTSAIFLLL